MRYLKKFENTHHSIDSIISKIKDKFTQEDVCDMFDLEVLEWVAEDWSEEYESEYDWYIDHNNGEAEDVVVEQLISWYEKEYGTLDMQTELILIDKILDIYDCL